MSADQLTPWGRARDWTCTCEQQYRVAAVDGEVRLWARNSVSGFVLDHVSPPCSCVRCGRPIRLHEA